MTKTWFTSRATADKREVLAPISSVDLLERLLKGRYFFNHLNHSGVMNQHWPLIPIRPLTEIVLVKIVSRTSKFRVRFWASITFIVGHFAVRYIQCIRTFNNMKRWCLVITFKHNFCISLRTDLHNFWSTFRRPWLFFAWFQVYIEKIIFDYWRKCWTKVTSLGIDRRCHPFHY